ncbi:carboxymethylenebutenolidase [Delphinella strobiligena]|nr:carboxymethylenebutenolidase [Delphinella strobiligena]
MTTSSATISANVPLPSPSAPSIKVSENITLQPALSRLGRGPGLFLIVDRSIPLDAVNEPLDPAPLQKWAEEGYTYNGKKKFGLITYLSKEDSSISTAIRESGLDVSAVVSYGSAHPSVKPIPHLLHSAGKFDTTSFKETSKIHVYPNAEPFFVLPSHKSFHSSSASVSHTRTLSFLKPIMGGPYFDLEAIWEEYTLYEFGERAVEKTMSTMVQEPYVNHIPTMTGGIGRERLTSFYRNHFIFNNPDDTALELISRTVGIDRVIDEFIFAFTHDKMIDWLVPYTSIVNIRGDRLYHEHIAWDQASILVQLGLMPQYLPFPYQVKGQDPEPGKRFEYRVPAAGVETAIKLTDENAIESNQMFGFWIREVDDV